MRAAQNATESFPYLHGAAQTAARSPDSSGLDSSMYAGENQTVAGRCLPAYIHTS